jgi:opacity protein-like surface antigen
LHYFNEHISLGAGVQYNTLNNLTHSSYTASTVNYDFGVKKDITTIKYLQLHYITIPVKIGFNAGKNNVFGIGANVSTLLNSDCRTDKYRTNNAEPMTETNRLSTKKETGYLTGFKAYDVQASAFYRRRIVKGLSVNAEFFYGLTDIKKNDHFKNNNFERAMGVKLTLCYDLFKK